MSYGGYNDDGTWVWNDIEDQDDDIQPEPWITRDTGGQILHGPSLICGCPLDSDCNGRH